MGPIVQVEEKTKLVCQPEGYYGPLTERELVVSASGTIAQAVPIKQAVLLHPRPKGLRNTAPAIIRRMQFRIAVRAL